MKPRVFNGAFLLRKTTQNRTQNRISKPKPETNIKPFIIFVSDSQNTNQKNEKK